MGHQDPTAAVTFVVDSVPDGVVRVDLTVTGPEMEAILGTIDVAAREDRITLQIPIGRDRNVFGRGFSVEPQITHIGEVYFDVAAGKSLVVKVPLNFKGEHLPIG